MGLPKIKLSNHTCLTHEMFRVGKYEEKIKFDKIWAYQNGGTVQTGSPNSNLLATHVRHMKFSGYANKKKR